MEVRGTQSIDRSASENSAVIRLKKRKEELLGSGLYDENEDAIIEEINRAIRLAESSIGRDS